MMSRFNNYELTSADEFPASVIGVRTAHTCIPQSSLQSDCTLYRCESYHVPTVVPYGILHSVDERDRSA